MPIPKLPPDPDGQNEDRAEWAEAALAEFQKRTRCDRQDAISDLLADLMHLCDRTGEDFYQLLIFADGNYVEECDGKPKQWSSPLPRNLGPGDASRD
jgi:hypothetical protein